MSLTSSLKPIWFSSNCLIKRMKPFNMVLFRVIIMMIDDGHCRIILIVMGLNRNSHVSCSIAPLWIMFVASIGINAESCMLLWCQHDSSHWVRISSSSMFLYGNMLFMLACAFMSALCSSVNERGRDIMLNLAVLAGFMLTMIADWNQDGFPSLKWNISCSLPVFEHHQMMFKQLWNNSPCKLTTLSGILSPPYRNTPYRHIVMRSLWTWMHYFVLIVLY